jgi:hypothetical protein
MATGHLPAHMKLAVTVAVKSHWMTVKAISSCWTTDAVYLYTNFKK